LSRKASRVMSGASARPEARRSISPEQVRLFQDSMDQSIRVVFLFPRTDAITLDDKDVELVTKLAGVDLKKKFKLADMLFRDQLAL